MARKLLIVDDDPDMRETIRFLVEDLCPVVEAGNGPEALRMIKRERPALMLLDVSLPDMDGLCVLQALRDAHAAITVVMLTGETDIDKARRALENGASAYVTKPFDPGFLKDEIRRLLADSPPEDSLSGKPWKVV